jgi:uncharacterized protein YbcI
MRISSLKYLDETNHFITRMADISIIDSFKLELKALIEEKYGMKVHSILKDYDPTTECSGTIVILDKNVTDYISG